MRNLYTIIFLCFGLLLLINCNVFGQCPPGPTTQPTAIGGPNPVCPGSVVVYSTTVGTDAASTTWSVPGGWTINSTTLTTLTTTAGAASGNVCVYAWSVGCGNSATTCAFITVNSNSTDPTGFTISTNPICPGNSTTLTVSGGSLGTGANWQWYSGGCGVTGAGTGSSIAVSPVTTTQYWVRAEGTCNNTNCATNTVTVNTNSVAAASVSAAPNPICVGSSTTLSLAGGSLGTGASWQWYSTACGGTLVGSGASLVLFPASTTTYFVRAEGTCNTTSCPAGVVVTVNTLSTAAGSISATANPVCNGSSTTLTPSGGSLGSGASWNWYTGSCGGTLVGTGNSLVVSPSSATTYYLRAEGTCNTTACVNLVINVTAQPSANAGSDGNECDLTHVLSATPSVGTGTWTQAGGPGATSYSNANDPNATATATAYGTYTYTWTENNSGCVSSDNVVISYYLQPVAFAGNDATVCGALSTNFAAVPSAGTGTWAQVSGPGVSGYSNPNAPGAIVTASTWGVYTYSWTENNGGCVSSDQVVISFYQQPVANAGTSTDQCDLDFTFNATPSVGTGTWTKVVGPGLASFSNANSPTATVTVTAYGSYLFRWTEVEGGCSDFDDVPVNFFEQPVADGGPDATICGLNYNMLAVYSAGTGLWTYVNGPGSSSFSNANSVNTNVTVSAVGIYTYEWFYDNNGCQDQDTVTLNFTSSTPPVANAGSDGSVCGLNYTLAAIPSIGTGTWTQIIGTGTSSFSNVNDPNAIATVDNYGMYVLRWTEANGNCSDDDDITVNFFSSPLADAGLNGSSCTLNYSFNASSSTGTGTWSQIAGAGSSSFSNSSSPTATVTATATGVYSYEWAVNNNGCTSADTIVIAFSTAPVANAGAGGNECDLDFAFGAVPSTGTGTWSQVTGTGTTGYSNANSPTATATATTYGTYLYRWTEVNGTCTSSADVTVNYLAPPLADAGMDGSSCNLNYTFNASSSATATWSQVAGAGSSSFSNSNSPIATVTVTVIGVYTYAWTANNNGCIASDTVVVTFSGPPAANAGTGGNECDLDFTFSAVPSTGTGTWTQISGPGTTGYSNANDPAATATATMYGTYIYRWTEVNGICSSSSDVTVNYLTPPLADAGADGYSCTLNHTFNASSSATATWTQVAGAGTSSFSNQNSPIATVTVTTSGVYTYSWTASNNGCISSDTVIVTFSGPPAANAGTGGNECDLDFIFSAIPSTGIGTWSQVSGPGISGYSNANDPAATATATMYGTYVYRWTEVNGTCTSSADITVNYFAPPLADAGLDGYSCSLNHTFNASSSATATWNQESGAGTSSFSNQNSPIATVTVTTSGVYTYSWTASNNGCISSDTVIVTFSGPPAANAGAGGNECDLDFVFNAVPSTGIGTWSQVSGPGISGYSNANDPAATVTATMYGTYIYRWTEVNGTCTSSADVTVNYFAPPLADAGPDASSCTSDYTFNASSSGTGTWSQLAGAGTSSFSNVNSPIATVAVSTTGIYTYEWIASNNGCTSADTVVIDFSTPPLADAGAAGNECDLDFIFSAVPSTGTGTWTQVSGPGTTGYSNANDPAASATATLYGTYIYRWTEVNGTCSSYDDVSVNYFAPPLADAGLDDSLCSTTYSFNASSSTGTGAWSQVSGAGVSSFLNANSPTTSVTVPVTGIYYYEWMVNNNGCVSSDTIRIRFLDPPTANAGTDDNECDLDAVLTASLGPGTGTWTQQSGPGIATFINPNNTTDTVTVSMYGTYIFRWTKLVGVCTVYDEVTVNFFTSPLADAGSDNTICFLNYSFNASSSTGSGNWSQLGGAGVSSFTNANSPTSIVSVSTTGIYTYEWAVNNNGCVSTDTVVINFSAPPSSDAGSGGNECDLDYIFSAIPSTGTGTWTQIFGTGTGTFSNPNDPVTTVTVNLYGGYIFRWTEVSGTCSSYDDVTVNFFMPPLADAGNDNSSCTLDYSFNASTSTGTGTWSQLSGPGASSYTNFNSPTATVTVTITGVYTYEWAVNNNGCLSSDTITLTFSPPPTADAGIDASDCGLDVTLNAIPSTGTGTWSQYFGPGSSGFTNVNDPNATVTVTMYGTYIFRWTEVSGSCSGVDEVTVNFFMPPFVSAGSDQNICGSQFFLTASSSTGTGTWSQLSGPGTATFSNINSPASVITVSLYGSYQLKWTVNNNGCVSADTINLTFSNPPLSDAGSDDMECSLTHDFSAISSAGTGLWTLLLGPGIAVFSDSTDLAATVTVNSYGTYIFQWKETNGTCSDSDNVTVDFLSGPSAYAGIDGTTCGLSWSLAATPSSGTGLWSQVLGTGVGVFANPADWATTVSVSQYGSYVFRWTETNGICSSSDDITVTFYEQSSAYAGSSGSVCDSVFDLVATASVGNGLWSQQSGPGFSSFSAVNSPATSVFVSAYGSYIFNWTETNGICTSSDTVAVNFYQQPVAFAGSSGKECDMNYVFSAVPSAGTGTWSMIVGNSPSVFSDANSPISNVAVSNPGSYIFRWTEVNGICSSYGDVVVNFYLKPIAFAGSDTVISLGNSAMLQGEGGDYYKWSPDSTLDNPNIANPIASPSQNETYRLIVTTIDGCSDTDEVSVVVLKDFNFGVSEVITPNDDGYNDQWKIDNIEFYTGCDVSIYNRYGNVVFEKKNYQNDWNGKYNGKPLPDGTYYYVIKCAGSEETWTGPITILK